MAITRKFVAVQYVPVHDKKGEHLLCAMINNLFFASDTYGNQPYLESILKGLTQLQDKERAGRYLLAPRTQLFPTLLHYFLDNAPPTRQGNALIVGLSRLFASVPDGLEIPDQMNVYKDNLALFRMQFGK